MEIGPTVKLIRQLKGFTQKEVYSGVVSHSFINRFEKGLNDIRADKLFTILKNLAVTPNEFQFIANNYHASILNQYLNTVMNLYDQRSFLALSKWIQTKKQQQKQVVNDKLKTAIGYAEVLLVTYSHINFHISNSINYLLSIIYNSKQWTLQEIKLAVALIPIVENSTSSRISLQRLINKMESSCQRYLDYDNDFFGVLEELIQFYGVLLQKYLSQRKFKQANHLITKFQQINRSLLDLGQNMYLQFWESIWGLYFGDYEQNKKQLESIMNVIKTFPINKRSDLQDIFRVRKEEAKYYREKINHM